MKTEANSPLVHNKVIVSLAQTDPTSVALADPLKTNFKESDLTWIL